MTAAEGIYLMCAATSLTAAWMLLRYYRTSRTALLLWSCVGFVGLALNNVLVYVDLSLYPSIDLSVVRALAGAIAMAALVYGLIWEAGR